MATYRDTLDARVSKHNCQSFGADIMALFRVRLYREIKRNKLHNVQLVSTVHDSIVADMPDALVNEYCKLVDEVASSVPAMFEQVFGVKYKVPFRVETTYGKTLKCDTEWKGN